jgi:hypothetical protein
MNKKFIRLMNLALLIIISAGFGLSEVISFDVENWEIHAKESRIENYLGRSSLFLKGGHAVVKDSEFSDGTIEYDVAFDGTRGFNGVVWRIKDDYNYEKFYIRPHQSGNPDANQYTPVFNGVSGWQLYASGNGYGAPYEYPSNEWIHVKVLVSGSEGEVYIGDMETPLFFINEMKTGIKSGKVGLVVEVPFLAPAYFSNFSYNNVKDLKLKGTATKEIEPSGTISSWQISNPFKESEIMDKYNYSHLAEDLSWQMLNSEVSGITNISRLHGILEKKNTAFAKVTIVSDSEQIKKLNFGFSSRIMIFLNGQLLYSGQDAFLTRDYRFLGTMGYYDDVYLSLTKGENELWMAISEDLMFRGGWGFQAKIEDQKGIKIYQDE